MKTNVILVDKHDHPIGEREKLAAHQTGALHRAFSIFLFDENQRWLLQRRHPDKYHSGGLWTNTCCSHPAPGEQTRIAARDRLRMEMGVETAIEPVFQFTYRAQLENGLIEHEFDHVFIGHFDGRPAPNAEEVCDWRWVDTPSLMEELLQRPEIFTHWFRLAAPRMVDVCLGAPAGGHT